MSSIPAPHVAIKPIQLSDSPDNLIESLITTCSTATRPITYFAHTMYLFTCDQFIDTLAPSTTFALFAALSGPILSLPSQPPATILLHRTPLSALWLLLLICQFCLQNQRTPSSIREDSANKPWRPLPTNRLTPNQTSHLALAVHLLSAALSFHLGVFKIYTANLILITAYNDFGAGDRSGLSRNVMCAAGFACMFAGATGIAAGVDGSLSTRAWMWIVCMTFGVLATTIQLQDVRDEEGDCARGRRTLVIELGRRNALRSVVPVVVFWTVVVPWGVFGGRWWLLMVGPGVAGVVLIRGILRAEEEGRGEFDRRMYRFWSIWMISFCPLPLLGFVFG